MKKMGLLVTVLLSLTFAHAGAMENEVPTTGANAGAAAAAAASTNNSSTSTPIASSASVVVPAKGESPSLLKWINSMDSTLLGWFRATDFGKKCTLGMGLAGLYTAHPHATKVVIVAAALTVCYRLWKKHNQWRKEIEEWEDED